MELLLFCFLLLYPLFPLLNLVGTVAAHGYVDFPPARQAGAATIAACGAPIVREILRDNTSHIEGLPELAAQNASFDSQACDLWLCRGIQFGDNVDNVQRYRAGQVVTMRVKLTIPHDGSANVSVVDTRNNRIIGEMLKYWARGYANEKMYYARTLPGNNTEFEVTLPDVRRQCRREGDCVLQWWWFGNRAEQTYESCVDFVMVRD